MAALQAEAASEAPGLATEETLQMLVTTECTAQLRRLRRASKECSGRVANMEVQVGRLEELLGRQVKHTEAVEEQCKRWEASTTKRR